jgi:predicted O-methyltransferase YrrM
MNWATLLDGIRGLNIAAIQVALRRREHALSYISACVRESDALLNRGLPARDPVKHLRETLQLPDGADTIQLPAHLHDGGGTRLEELVYLAGVTRLLQPRKIFEIGTFKGRTTTVFALNAPDADILTLDLPPEYAPDPATYIRSDAELVRRRNPIEFIDRYGVGGHCRQVLCDSKQFDPRPHEGTVDLVFIDGAHTFSYVKNDTEKAAVMMAPGGLVFWHDYGGKGQFRGITDYLHGLARRFPVYRISGTSLAWTTADHLKALVATPLEERVSNAASAVVA